MIVRRRMEAKMVNCAYATKWMLKNPIEVRIGDRLDFSTAKFIADRRAREKAIEPMLLAWFDKKSGKFAPDQICCDREKPSWLVYAEACGGDITVDINNEEFVFVYRDVEADVFDPLIKRKTFEADLICWSRT